jgi:hypothetical protein
VVINQIILKWVLRGQVINCNDLTHTKLKYPASVIKFWTLKWQSRKIFPEVLPSSELTGREGGREGGRVLYEINAFSRRLRDRLLKIFRASGKTWSNETLYKYASTLRALIVTMWTEIRRLICRENVAVQCIDCCRIVENRFWLSFVWVWNLVAHIEEGTQAEGVWE